MSTDGTTVTMPSAAVDDRQILQAELARVNLLRIRGDVSSSKTLCLSVLKRFPESIDAHVMMGDLHAEQGDLAPAAEWYSLALDLDRNAPGVAVKLSRIQAALDISGHATRSRVLIANGKRMSPWLYVAVAASAIAIVAVGYIAGLGSPTKNGNSKAAISDRIESPKAVDNTPKPVPSTESVTIKSPLSNNSNDLGPAPATTTLPSAPIETKTTGPKETPLLVVDDQKLFEQVSNQSKFGKHVISIIADPREKGMILTYNVSQGEHGRYMGAILADVAMEYDNKVLKVTVRGVRNGVLSYIADVPREKIMAVEDREKKDVQDIESKGWIDEVLTNEYFKSKDLLGQP
jgi:hypothetical protein